MAQFENEIWKPTTVNPYYLVSNCGRIRSLDRPIWFGANKSFCIRKGKILHPTNKNSKRYWRISIPFLDKSKGKKTYQLHRLVAEAFIPNPNNYEQVNHIDGNKNNNHVSNLEWCTNLQNMQHALEHGLVHNKEMRKNLSLKTHLRKLTEEQVLFIKQEWQKVDTTKRGEKYRFCKELAKQFNLNSFNTINWIINNQTNKFSNQDIVQTTNFEKYLEERKRIRQEMSSKYKQK